MKKAISTFFLILLFFHLGVHSLFAKINEDDPLTPEKVLKISNEDMEKLYKVGSNYYQDSTSKGPYRKDLIQNKINERKNNFIIVYGKSHGEELFHKGVKMFAYSGYTVRGTSVSTEGAPWYAGWSGTKIQDFNMVKEPWKDVAVQEKYSIRKSKFDKYVDKENIYLRNSNGTFEKAILTGLNDAYAGKKYKEFMYNNQNKTYKDRIVYDYNAQPNKGQWIDYVHILQPPTFHSWGEGRIYIKNMNGDITYLGIPIAPFVLQFDDLSAYFENIPQNKAVDETVLVRIRLNSGFEEEVETDFIWDIRTQSGQRLDVSFKGHQKENSESGIIVIPPMGEQVLDAVFTMPEEAVEINFTLNETQKKPKETTYSNNSLSATIQPVQPLPPNNQEFTLDYNVLSRKVKFDLNKGNAITAKLQLPERKGASWEGNATGNLEVNNNAPDLFHDFTVTNNPAVDVAAELIERFPKITMKFKREDFGDDPLNRKWFESKVAVIEQKKGSVSFNGSVSRPYSYIFEDCDEDGNCIQEIIKTVTSASFTPGEDNIEIKAKIYNGKETIEPKKYLQDIYHNNHESFKKDLYWTSEPYRYKVIRWMAHQQADNTLSDWTAVDGQYDRIFTQQASGKLEWKVERSLGEEYEQGRDAAKRMTNRKDLYDKAVFATDKELQKYDYPIKSGYYFNPAGSYTFTIKTVTYKPTKDDTKDHQGLVDAITSSFRYETDLMYINKGLEAVNLLNERLPAYRNSYSKKPAALSKDNPQGVDGHLLLTVLDRKADESRYQKDVVEIKHSQNSGEFTHEYWKNILEGYSESGTIKSKEDYKYREYVKENQNMYQITETTKVTIVINPENISIFTHAHMPDGQYYVRAWLEDIQLSSSSNYYNVLPDLKGVTSLDEIQVTVQGSIYDDVNN